MGIVVIRHRDQGSNCLSDLYWGLYNINHTGQECCGVALSNGRDITHESDDNLVRAYRTNQDMCGYCGIGNVSVVNDHQPRIFSNPRLGKFALTFDGFLVNEDELRGDIGELFASPHQVEIVAKLIGQGSDFPDGIEKMAKRIVGPYCIGIVTEGGELFAARGPLAMKPLIYGHAERGYGVNTESRGLRRLDMTLYRDFEPGEVVKIDEYGVHSIKKVEGRFGRRRKHCSFLWGYYSWIDSVIDSIPVSVVRERCGAKLAEYDRNMNFDVVDPVPDSGKGYAEGYAMASRHPFSDGLIKYAYALRSYTRPTQKERDMEADSKLSVVESRVRAKKIVLCDDSIRRGTQIRRGPVKLLRNAGAKEIHIRVGTPRNTAYCRFDKREVGDETLLANRFKTDEEIAEYLGVDGVKFIRFEDFIEALTTDTELTQDDFCWGCYTGDFSFCGLS